MKTLFDPFLHVARLVSPHLPPLLWSVQSVYDQSSRMIVNLTFQRLSLNQNCSCFLWDYKSLHIQLEGLDQSFHEPHACLIRAGLVHMITNILMSEL